VASSDEVFWIGSGALGGGIKDLWNMQSCATPIVNPLPALVVRIFFFDSRRAKLEPFQECGRENDESAAQICIIRYLVVELHGPVICNLAHSLVIESEWGSRPRNALNDALAASNGPATTICPHLTATTSSPSAIAEADLRQSAVSMSRPGQPSSRALTATEELEKIEQSITLTLQGA
jgi:hypothetical protein